MEKKLFGLRQILNLNILITLVGHGPQVEKLWYRTLNLKSKPVESSHYEKKTNDKLSSNSG